MINDGQVTLVGFGHAAKITDHKPNENRSVRSQSKYDFTFSAGSSGSGDSIEQVQQSITGPYNDVVSIYYMMIAELLQNNFSAFNHDEDCDEIIVIDPSELADPDQKPHPKNIYTYGSNLANYLTVQAAQIQVQNNEDNSIDYLSYKKGLLTQRLKILENLV